MDPKTEKLALKLKDYKRFIATLLIISSYFYMGAIINIYIKPSSDGSTLCYLSLGAIVVSTWFMYQHHRVSIKLKENERV